MIHQDDKWFKLWLSSFKPFIEYRRKRLNSKYVLKTIKVVYIQLYMIIKIVFKSYPPWSEILASFLTSATYGSFLTFWVHIISPDFIYIYIYIKLWIYWLLSERQHLDPIFRYCSLSSLLKILQCGFFLWNRSVFFRLVIMWLSFKKKT